MALSDTLLWLCSIPSPIGEERELCNAVAKRLEHARLHSPIRRYQNSIVAPLTRGTGGPHVLLAGHLDVVRTDHAGEPRIEGDKLFGPGASDMKSGLALMIDIAECAERAPVDLTLVFYAREEGPFDENELGPVLERDQEVVSADVAVALEPSDNKLQLGCGGSVHANVRFHGRTAHSARPWQGENAIHKSAAFLTRLSASHPEPSTTEGLVWKSVMSATLARGGRARNVVPDVFELNVNRRFGPGETVEQAQQRIAEIAHDADGIEFVDIAPPAPPFRSHRLVEALVRSGVECVEPKSGWTDVARFTAVGIPAVNFGPGVQAQAHQQNEWTSVKQLDRGRAILDVWLRSISEMQDD